MKIPSSNQIIFWINLVLSFFIQITFCQNPQDVLRINQWTYTQSSPSAAAVEIIYRNTDSGAIFLGDYHLRLVTSLGEEFSLALPLATISASAPPVILAFPELFGQSSASMAIVNNNSPPGLIISLSDMADFVYWGSDQSNYLTNAAVSAGLWDLITFPIATPLSLGQSYNWDGSDTGEPNQSWDIDFAVLDATFDTTASDDFQTQCDIYGNGIEASAGGYSTCELSGGIGSSYCSAPLALIQTLSLRDDEGVSFVLPFPFTFYGLQISSVSVSSNGFLDFSGVEATSPLVDCPLDSDFSPSPIFAMLWADHDPSQGGQIDVSAGLSPNNNPMLVFSYVDVPRFGNPSIRSTFSAGIEFGTNSLFTCITQGAAGAIGIRDSNPSNTPITVGNCEGGSNIGDAYLFQVGEQQVTDDGTSISTGAIVGIIFGVFFGVFCCLVIIGVVVTIVIAGGATAVAANSRPSSNVKHVSVPKYETTSTFAPEKAPAPSHSSESGPPVSSQTNPYSYPVTAAPSYSDAPSTQGAHPHPDSVPSYGNGPVYDAPPSYDQVTSTHGSVEPPTYRDSMNPPNY